MGYTVWELFDRYMKFKIDLLASVPHSMEWREAYLGSECWRQVLNEYHTPA